MIELLNKHSKLEVIEAKNEMLINCNKVYLIPSDKFMTVKKDTLYLFNKSDIKGLHHTVNTFFISLAANSGKKAIGVILSGLGSDGTDGIMAIKKAGGMAIARNPETTSYSGMPSSAIATGLVDFILEPEAMPKAIEDYVNYENNVYYDLDHEVYDDSLNAILEIIKDQSPLDFTDYKKSTILRRVKRRTITNNFTTLVQYLEYLKNTPEEVAILAKDFLISVTSFFRDPDAFNYIKEKVIPKIIENLTPKEEIKIWISGCASGEEAYSFAILFAEVLEEKNKKDHVVKIFSTDVDTDALLLASKGVYPLTIAKQVSEKRLAKYFVNEGKNYRITSAIRKTVIFAQHDLVKNPPYCNMHFISCRNLLIYMTPKLQKKIYLLLLFGLKMDGYLFLGPSESPVSIIQNLETVNKKWKIFRNLEAKRVVRFDAFTFPILTERKLANANYQREEKTISPNYSISDSINETLVGQLNCLIVCVDKNKQVIKTYGDTSKYLIQQNFNNNLLDLLPRPLLVAFNTLASQASKDNKSFKTSNITIKHGEENIKVSLTVSPLLDAKRKPDHLILTLTDDKITDFENNKAIAFDERIYLDQYTLNLEEELKDLKEKLQFTYEQLDNSNENMQSFNEELLSTNEEMQSTNEEMQSVNEELHTINTDYQLKNKELLELNDDLNNYFRSNINGQLFVNNDLILMKYSPGTVKQINLLPSDIGRPLSHVSTNIKFETIIDDIKKVIDEGVIFTKEIETNNGKWYQIMTMPYIQLANQKRTGAIITFNDITRLKSVELDLDEKNRSLLRINADLDNFILAASHDLLAPLSNIQTSINVMNKIPLNDEKLMSFINIINQSVMKFSTLVKDIATIAKIKGDMLDSESVDIKECINNVEWSLENRIAESKAIIHKSIQAKTINFSKKNLRSIIYNLICNAIKFSGDKESIIKIETRLENKNTILTVEDNGIGMPADGLDRIFEMYGRLNQEEEGYGIGLYLAKKIINSSGGQIIVKSELGKGTKFTIILKNNFEILIKNPTQII
jgi:two-component system CheB/CheR fusion protein